MPNPVATRLSMAQRQLPASRYASLAGAVLGVTLGCILGATTLFFVDLDARDRIQRAQQFKQVLGDMTHLKNTGGAGSFPCREVVVHLAVKAHQHYDWKSLNKDDDDADGGKKVADGPRVRIQSLDLRDEAKDDNGDEKQEDLVLLAAQKQDVLVRGQRLFAPIMRREGTKHDQIWAVVEFEKEGSSVEEIDIQRIRLMAAHLAIFMARMAD
jgi:hypothetical protein